MEKAVNLINNENRKDIEQHINKKYKKGTYTFLNYWRGNDCTYDQYLKDYFIEFKMKQYFPNEIKITKEIEELKNNIIRIYGWSDEKQCKTQFKNWVLLDNDIIIGTDYMNLYLEKRIPNEEYWPSEENIIKLREEWTEKLYAGMVEYINEYPEYKTDDLIGHYMYAKRRYGIKNNVIVRLAYLTNVDPEGRFRCYFEAPPDYVLYELILADENVGRKLGLKEDQLYDYRHLG